jgi:hypothetical protein
MPYWFDCPVCIAYLEAVPMGDSGKCICVECGAAFDIEPAALDQQLYRAGVLCDAVAATQDDAEGVEAYAFSNVAEYQRFVKWNEVRLGAAYGPERIDLAKRAGPKRDWQQVECVPYGEKGVKAVRTFEALKELEGLTGPVPPELAAGLRGVERKPPPPPPPPKPGCVCPHYHCRCSAASTRSCRGRRASAGRQPSGTTEPRHGAEERLFSDPCYGGR